MANNRYEKLLDIAQDRLKFEIGLLWQRSLFFWGFTVAGFAGYAYFFTKEDYEKALLVAGFGFLSSVIWTLANRGSKFWQEYWEYQIQKVKSRIKKYKFFDNIDTYEGKKEEKENKDVWNVWNWRFWDGERFSLSRLIIALSDYVVASWFLILITQSLIIIRGSIPEKNVMVVVAFVVVLITIAYSCLVYHKTKKHYEPYVTKT